MDKTNATNPAERLALNIPTAGHRPIDVSFQKALYLLQQHAPAEFSGKTNQWTTIEDVICHIRIAEAKYSSRPSGKTWKWVTRLSSKVLFYSQVLDVLAQQHPEYVSLAWGAFKFVFMGVINHEALIKELAKAMTRVADVVKHVQTQSLLYPTIEILEHISELYSQIMTFAIRAVEWYQKGKIAHAVAAFTSPFQLKYRDIIDDIYETSRKIDRCAMTMNYAEIRQMHEQLAQSQKALELAHIERREMYRLVAEVKGVVSQYGQLNHAGILNTNQRLSEIQFSQILSFISTSPIPRPDLVRQSYVARRNRRQKEGSRNITIQSSWISDIQEWGERKTSTQIFVQGSFRTRHSVRDFAANTIDLVAQAGIPVVWALDPRMELPAENHFNANDVLKYLACQVLQLNNSMLTERHASLNSARFQSAITEEEWLELLTSVLHGMSQIYIIVDMDLVKRAGGVTLSWVNHFASLEDNLRLRNIHTVVKVACVGTSKSLVKSLPRETKVVKLDAIGSGRITKRVSKMRGRLQNMDQRRLKSAIQKGME
ncbi:hypothetical protein HD806DRAFT_505830 [Xylariaceae sp. AK1471]|nr:hypothetical protein HD806DRAFT_505830 [Xylariaceae sp. AK1471]